ncbi:hypothetical protein K32_28250 [Kaistia sp. 32K]|nr:hypothetical protein K32_28250 [Kaistia sp. 32K]
MPKTTAATTQAAPRPGANVRANSFMPPVDSLMPFYLDRYMATRTNASGTAIEARQLARTLWM